MAWASYLAQRDLQTLFLGIVRPVIVGLHPTAHVGAKVPDPRPDWVVTVRRDGGGMLDQVQFQAMLGINIWAPTEVDAYALAAVVEQTMLQAVDGSLIFGVESTSGPAPLPEQAPACHLYMTFETVVSGL